MASKGSTERSKGLIEGGTAVRTLMVTRLLWIAIFGGWAMAGVAASMLFQTSTVSAQTAQTMGYAALGVSVLLVALGYVIRLSVFRRGRVGEKLEPGPFFVGNLIFFASTEAAGIIAIVLLGLSGGRNEAIGGVAVAVLAHLLNFPLGSALKDDQMFSDLTQ